MKQQKQAILDFENNSHDVAACAVIESTTQAYMAVIESNKEWTTLFKEKKKRSSMTTITQQSQAQIEQQELEQEDNSNNNNNNNVFNELITYYNNGDSGR